MQNATNHIANHVAHYTFMKGDVCNTLDKNRQSQSNRNNDGNVVKLRVARYCK